MQPKHNLVLIGPPGTGKTYICSALIDVMLDYTLDPRSFRVYKEINLLSKLRSKISDGCGDYDAYLKELVDDRMIIIDDLGSSSHTEFREDVLFSLLDYRYERRLPTIFSTNLSKGDINETYNDRIYSRLFAEENTVIDMRGMPDRRTLGQ